MRTRPLARGRLRLPASLVPPSLRVRPASPVPASTDVGDTATRLLRRARRSPIVRTVVVLAVALVALSSIRSRQTELDHRIAELGRRVPVAVVLADHAPGDLVGPDDVEVREVPASLVPEGAVGRLVTPRRLRDRVGRGELLVTHRLADGSLSALAAATPPGTRALAVPLPAAALALTTGDRVDLAAVDPSGRTTTLVRDALVVRGTSDPGHEALVPGAATATIAVPRRMVGPVADAVLASTLTVALVGRAGP